MFSKTSVLNSPQGKLVMTEEKLGCYRVWARTRASRKDLKRRDHMILGPFPLGLKK